MCARIISASAFRFCLRDEHPFAKGILWRINGKRKKIWSSHAHNLWWFLIFLHAKKHISNSPFRWSAFGVVFSTACFAVSQFANTPREPTHRRHLAHWKPFQEMMWWRYLLQPWLCLSLLLVKFTLEARLIRHCLPLSSLVSRCVYFIAKTWSCVVQRAQEQFLYEQTLLCPV